MEGESAVSGAWSIGLLAWLGLGLVFVGVYAVARRLDNYGVVDIAWSYAFGALVLVYALATGGWGPRRVLMATLVLLWSLRLGTHLYRRVMGHHPVEDGRYQKLRKDWREHFHLTMFGFFQMQAASVVLLGIPFLLVMRNPAPTLHPLEILGVGLWVLALGGEALADAQLAKFRREVQAKGQVCQRGLWRYSRHPNYFFEWLVWVAYFVFACASPWGWIGLLSPLVILYLLLRVTGIPLTEEQAIRSKGAAYRRYQQTTSAFVPWPPRAV